MASNKTLSKSNTLWLSAKFEWDHSGSFQPHCSKCWDFNDHGKQFPNFFQRLKRGLTSPRATNATTFLLFLLLHPTTAPAFGDYLFFHHINDLIRNTQVFDGAATDVTFRHPPEFVSILSKKIHKKEGCSIGLLLLSVAWILNVELYLFIPYHFTKQRSD